MWMWMWMGLGMGLGVEGKRKGEGRGRGLEGRPGCPTGFAGRGGGSGRVGSVVGRLFGAWLLYLRRAFPGLGL